MKTLRILALLAAAGMFLAACGTGDNGTPGPTTGTLTVNVGPVAGDITVTDAADAVVDTQVGKTTYTWTNVAPGTYNVAVAAPAGYLDSPPQAVTVTAGGVAVLNVTLAQAVADGANVGAIEIVGFTDEDGNAYDWTMEINPVVDKVLMAAQTEEMVGVAVLVTDEEGEPAANLPVTVSITNDFLGAVAIYPGKPTASAQTFQGLKTDADGMVYFVIEATNATVSVQELLFSLDREPVKIIVSAVGNDNVAKRTEFKSFFTNMSHLWKAELGFRSGDSGNGKDFGDLTYAEQRIGADLGLFTNVWRNDGENEHVFGTVALTKQPSIGPFPVGIGVIWGPQAGAEGLFPGYMTYTLVDGDIDDVQWVGCDEVIGYTCYVEAAPVALEPKPTVKVEDLPISVTVHAEYFFQITYGNEIYTFLLKDYTFTKEWVGGYLVIDKFVDQHVLTWRGALVTLGPVALDYDQDYVSTVHVLVSNPSDSPIYNVTVRDVVPAELGVVRNSISDNGTYDPVNHAVTWNNVDTPGLAVVDPGEELFFTFEVYARHKPGYCWDPAAFRGDIPPLFPPPLQEEDCDPYDDPYKVTNGAAYRDFSNNQIWGVTAAGFTEDSVAGEQLVWTYFPREDESDIWVVRPFFSLVKERISDPVMAVGAAATYDIRVRQIDRVSTVRDPGNTEYNFLYQLYPWEFTGDLGTGSGHVPLEPYSDPADALYASDVRNNPYARNIIVTDTFEYALDFTAGLNFDGTVVVPANVNQVEKTVTFKEILDLPRVDPTDGTQVVKVARLTLTANLPSDDGFGVPQNGAIRVLENSFLYAWNNCAYLAAPQLNQPHPETDIFADTIYARPYPTNGLSNLWIGPDEPWRAGIGYQWHQVTAGALSERPATELVRGFGDLVAPLAAVGQLEYCALVAVIPPPPTPLMTLTTNGEFFPNDLDPDIIPPGADGFLVGTNFIYKMSAINVGEGQADNVVIAAELSNANVRFLGQAQLYISDTGLNGSWSLIQTQNIPVQSGSVTFDPIDVDGVAGDNYVRILVQARATGGGSGLVVDNTTTLTYDNAPPAQLLPLLVVEETTIVR